MTAPRRTRVRRNSLSRALVVEAAITLLDRDGPDKVTMRAVASALGAQQMSIYNYVSGKADLFAAVEEHLYSTLRVPDPATAGIEEFVGVYRELWRLLKAHPWLVHLHIAVVDVPDMRLRMAEATYAILFRLGLSAREAVIFSTAAGNLVLGCAALYAEARHTDVEADRAAAIRRLAGGYPSLIHITEVQDIVLQDDVLDFGLAALVRELRERTGAGGAA
ncbi:DNA-binding transcriptional regulator, AcrR family [Sinosporangium album]|uniref:DNA-binding transcriptional regulator, AcrR family n=1 Tax=Sinosporangium album TaxID=504805 RepID=A0A1G8JJQ1_9ACTN|nr:TetR/AcrR family transcriptional regulator [Sinosporangium album]SDI31257.1 DNA-binding transcriptional regulator, AcrR family [Sinosporangium album]